MKKSRIISLFFGTLTASWILSPLLVSCGCGNSNDLIKTFTISDGPSDIVIDQSSSSDISGRTFEPWNAYVNGSVCNPNDVTWELINCDDPAIKLSDGYIYWNNPKPKNTTFQIKVSILDQQSGKLHTQTSNTITLYADPNTIKVEFVNDDPLARTINAVANIASSQNNPWYIKVNGSVYSGPRSTFELIDSNGLKMPNFTFDDNNKLSWDSNISVGNGDAYISAKIVDTVSSKSYNIYSTNAPISIQIGKPKLSFTGGESECYARARVPESVGNWKAINGDNKDISTSATTIWSLENTGSAEFGDNISIDKGELKCTANLPVGNYQFNIVVTDTTQSKTIKTATPVNLYCYEPLEIRGGSEVVMAQAGKQGTLNETWSLYSEQEPLDNVKFEIVARSPEEEQEIQKLKEHVKLEPVESVEKGSKVKLTWDAGLTASDKEILFKIQAEYNGTKVLSNNISFNITDPSKYSIKVSGPQKIYTTKTTKNQTSSGVSLPNNKQIASNDDPVFEGKMKIPYQIHLSTGDKIQWKAATYKIDSGLEQAKFIIDDDGYLCWYGLESYRELSQKELDLHLMVEYTLGSDVLKTDMRISFNVVELSDGKALVKYGPGYSINSETTAVDTKFYPPWSNNTPKMLEGFTWTDFPVPDLDSTKRKDYTCLRFFNQIKNKYKEESEYAAIQTLQFNIPVLPKTQFTANLAAEGPRFIATSPTNVNVEWYHKIGKHFTLETNEVQIHCGIYNYGEKNQDFDFVPSCQTKTKAKDAKYYFCDLWDKKAHGAGGLWFGSKEENRTASFKDNGIIPTTPITLVNNTDQEQIMHWYIGVWTSVHIWCNTTNIKLDNYIPITLRDIEIKPVN